MENDLIGLQQSSKSIRNPFGFDFISQWDGKKIVLKGDGKERMVIGPLADHIARHLFMKVFYQFHDEQVAALKLKGDTQAAIKYRVPQSVENLIWRMITGKDKYQNVPAANVENEADLTELKKNMTKLEKEAGQSSEGINISKVLEKAQAEAITAGENLGEGETTSVQGTSEVNEKPKEEEKPAEEPKSDEPVEVGEPVAPATPEGTVPAGEEEKKEEENAEDSGEPEAPQAPAADAAPEGDESKADEKGEFPGLQELD